MKTILSKINLTAIALCLLVLPNLSSCKKDDDKPAAETGLQGEWIVNSFTIDGVEAKGLIIKASKIEFDANNAVSGDFTWSITYTDNSTDIVHGDYLLADDNIVLDSHGEEPLVLNLKLDGNALKLSGDMDEGYVVVKADRK